MKKLNILLFLAAKNFNEEEFLTIKNSLEKANKKIFIASDTDRLCVGENGLKVKADINLLNIHSRNFGAFVIIGGFGIVDYFDNSILQSKAKQFFENGHIISAICASPIIIGRAGLLKNIDSTCFPKYTNELSQTGANVIEQDVISVGNIITGSGADASSEFSHILLQKINQM